MNKEEQIITFVREYNKLKFKKIYGIADKIFSSVLGYKSLYTVSQNKILIVQISNGQVIYFNELSKEHQLKIFNKFTKWRKLKVFV